MSAHITEVWLENRRGAPTIGIDDAAPRLSWIGGAPSGRYALEFAADRLPVQTATVNRRRLVDWPFEPLAPRQGGWLRIRAEEESEWSAPLRIEAGIGGDWRCDFVSPSTGAPHESPRPAYLLRASFDLSALGVDLDQVDRARVYSSAHGVYELELNGLLVSDDRLAPGWTSYRHRLRSQTYDVTTMLREGGNAIGAWLADGWYRGHFGFDGGLWNIYGTDVSLLLQLEVTTRDGALVVVPLEQSWRWRESAITATGLYEGETNDARLHPVGWSEPGFGCDAWRPTLALPRDDFTAAIEAPTGPPVREIETLKPISVENTSQGRVRLDFGQNIAGVLRIRVRGERGHSVRLHHAEVLENGRLGTRPLRGATSIDTYVCAGDGVEEWSPRFTIHGFRYAELEGWPGAVADGDVEAVVLHTDMRRTGWFSSSHAGLNRLHENVVWSMRDNFVDLPTDCPQRDERMGWTGDIQVFAPTALRLFAAHGTLTGWLRDLAAEQWTNGHVPQFVPWVECGFPNFPTAAWGDAAVIVPWELYHHDGDTRVLADQYPSMCAWVDLVDRLTGHTGLWNKGFQLGDWLDPAAPPESPGDSQTDRYLVATAYHVKSARLLAETARILGKTADAERYAAIADRALQAFQREFVSDSGRIVSDTPSSLAVAIVFELLPAGAKLARAGERLLELVRAGGYRISTGFVGTPIICDALVAAGGLDAAYRLLLQDTLPSWLYPVTMGATTIWERWDSMLPDGTINPGDMTSFNHYALGAVADFLHRVVAGLAADAPGWSRIRFAPLPGGQLASASARHDTPLGEAFCGWEREGATLRVEVRVPPDAVGTVVLPGQSPVEVGAGTHRFEIAYRAVTDDPVPELPSWRDQLEDA